MSVAAAGLLLCAAVILSAAAQPSTTTVPASSVPATPTTASVTTSVADPTSSGTGSSSTSTSEGVATTTATPSSTSAPSTAAPRTTVRGSGTTLPSGPPPGFTQQQFDTFVGVVTACGPDPGTICSHIYAWTGNRTLSEATQWVADVPVRVLLILGVAIGLNWLVRSAIDRYVQRLMRRSAAGENTDRSRRERGSLRLTTASSTLASGASVAIFAAALVLALAQFDVSLGPLLAGAGIIGVALGFGAQNVVRDVLAGLFVLVEDQYGIGDVIDAGRASGVVEGISLRVTKLRDVEGTLWFVPNGTIAEVANRTQRWARVILDIAVPYEQDHHRAGRLIKEAADDVWRHPAAGTLVLEEPELWGIEELGESAVIVRLAVKCAPADQWDVARARPQPHQGPLRLVRGCPGLPVPHGVAPRRRRG